MAKQATAEKRQRRERGSINPDDIIKGAFELAEEVGIDNLSMPLLGKHLGVGVTSIYWYFRKKDDLLNAMTDRALRQYVFATPYVEAKDWRETLRNHARTMRKTFMGNPILCDLILIRSALSPRAARARRAGGGEGDRQPGRGGPVAPRTPSTPTPRCRCTSADRWCCSGSARRTGRRDDGPSDYRRRRWPSIRRPTPLLALVTEKGHHIGAADEKNFEYGLECILDHAEPADRRGEEHARQEARAQTLAISARYRRSARSARRNRS